MSDEDEGAAFVLPFYDPPSTFHFIIPNSTGTQVLVKHPDKDGPFPYEHQLPVVSPPTDVKGIPVVHSWDSQTGDLSSVVLRFLGLRLYVRDLVWRDPTLSCDSEENILVGDLLEPNNIPPSFFWASLDKVEKVPWKSIRPEVQIPTFVSRVLSASRSCASPLQETKQNGYGRSPQPWRQVGWFADVERWFFKTIKDHSVSLYEESRLMQLRNTRHSTLFHCPLETATKSDTSAPICFMRTAQHYIFLKSSCARIPEALITKAVAYHLPAFVPKLLATRDECTFIQFGAEARTITDAPPTKLLQSLADMQHRSLELLESLQADGVPYHGLDWYAKNFADMLRHPALKSLETGEVYKNILNHIEDLQTLFAELDSYKIPQTLIHGDFDSSNVLIDPEERTLRFIDWASSAIGHPFIDFLRSTYIDDYGTEDQKAEARDLYLRRWEHYESKENILRAADLAHPVMICESMNVLLKMYECVGLSDREHILTVLEERLESISYALTERRSKYCKYRDESDSASLLIITREHGSVVLAKQGDGAFSLPFISVFEISGKAATDAQLDSHGMRIMIKSQLGIDTRVVRSLWLRPEDESMLQRSAVVLETLDNDHQIPPGYKWVDASSVRCFSDGQEREQAIVEAFFGVNEGQLVAPPQMPWRHFGWLTRAREWADHELLTLGLKRKGAFHEVKTDLFGTVWTAAVKMTDEKRARAVHNSTDRVFLKEGIFNASEGNEGNVLSVISTFARGVVPSLISMASNSSCFLTTGIGTADTLNMNWSLLFQGLGELQIRSSGYVDSLVKAGLRRFDCHWVRRNSERLLEVSSDLLGEARAVSMTFEVSDVVRCMKELEHFKLPLTLVHGDFHVGNIGKQTQEGYGIFDWGSAFIGIPFCDIAVMTKLSDIDFDDEEDWQEGYLSVWKGKIVDTDFDRAVDLSLVYYLFLNLETLLVLMKEVATVDTKSVKKLVSVTLKRLNIAMERVAEAGTIRT